MFKIQFKIKLVIVTGFFSNFPSNLMYPNERLSLVNRKIWVTKHVAVKYNYKFVWSLTVSSGVFLKKKEGNTGVIVRTLSKLITINIKKIIECLWSLL